MARLERFEPVYGAFRRFVDQCILDDMSLLWPEENAWMLDNVTSLKHQLVDNPIIGADLSFEEKLRRQMQDASSQHWIILGDVYYVYLLVSSFFTLGYKTAKLRWVVEQGNLPALDFDNDMWSVAQQAGFTRTGQRYHTKYGQFWFVLMFAERVKQLEDAETALGDFNSLQELLDDLLEQIDRPGDRAYDMRHAILYMMFPEEYERIISSGDKGRIKTHYAPLVPEISGDPDEAIRRIRDAI